LKSVKLMGVKELMVGDCVGRMEDEHGPDEQCMKIIGNIRALLNDEAEFAVQARAGRRYEELVRRDDGMEFSLG
jgi:hypothetical protein